MTNEKMLELVNDYMGNKDFDTLMKLKLALTENIRMEIEKSKGTKPSELAVVKRVMKDCESAFKNNYNERRIGYHPFTLNGMEYKAFTDGHYIVAGQSDYGYKKADDVLKNMGDFFKVDGDKIELKIDMKDLKLFIKTHKKADKKPYIIETEKIRIGFNPYFLKNGLEFCETDKIYVTKDIQPALMGNNNATKLAFVLPVRLTK